MNKEKFKEISKKIFHSWYWLIVLIVGIDQVSKFLAVKYLSPAHQVEVQVIKNFFYFRLTYNTGAAWSFLAGKTGLLMAFSLVAAIIMIVFRIIRGKMFNTNHKIISALIIGGTVGNLIDRFLTVITKLTGVVDFISFDFGTYSFPIFNIADMMLVIGVIYLLILILVTPDKDKKAEEQLVNESSDITSIEEQEVSEENNPREDENEKDLDKNEL